MWPLYNPYHLHHMGASEVWLYVLGVRRASVVCLPVLGSSHLVGVSRAALFKVRRVCSYWL